ncbi:MAG: DoxX family protein [Caulobacteraceae bacterium]|jgi:putative oxidoreductase|nr:DoxX family protein [Caulobacteraceae bacterium]
MGLPSSWSARLLSVLRIVAGLCFMEHGAMKLLHFPAPVMPGPLPPLLVLAGAIELVAGLLVVIGLFTRPAAFIASGEMAVAYFGFHVFHLFPGSPPGSVSFDPQANHGAEAALYAVIFLYIAAAGGGAWALDTALPRRRAVP